MRKQLEKSIRDYSRNGTKNLEYRIELFEACNKDPGLAAHVRRVFEDDIVSWINLTAWSKNPRVPAPNTFPLILYDFQETYVLELKDAIDNQYDYLTDKTREMGVSWCVLYVLQHYWQFKEGSDFRVGSRKEEYVDKLNVIDTLLEKVRFNTLRQPPFLLPQGFSPKEHAGFMRIFNPELQNGIFGESANPHFGSGGRSKAIMLDEFAKWEPSVASAAWTATADVTGCRLPVSTPVGSGNKFGMLANEEGSEKIKKISLHYTLHPVKAKGAYYMDHNVKIPIKDCASAYKIWKSGVEVCSPWYDAEKERRSESDFAQEINIDYLRSGRPFFKMTQLAKQRAWVYFERKLPIDLIPHGKFIKAKLVEVDHAIELRESKEGWLRIFELPRGGYQYVVGTDAAEGLEKGDEDFIVVRCKITRNVVAAANGIWGTDMHEDFAQKIGKFYNDARVAPENNNHGFTVCKGLKELDCNLYYTTKSDEGDTVGTKKAGWSTTHKSRPVMLDQMEEEVRKMVVELRDSVLLAQCRVFIKNPKKGGKPEADGSFKDDGVIACGIAGDVIKKEPFAPKRHTADDDIQRAALIDEYKKPMAGYRKK